MTTGATMLGIHACSMVVKVAQPVPPRTWTDVRFPYGALESEDLRNMHREVRSGVKYAYPSARESALIDPCHSEWANVVRAVVWASTDAWTEGERPTQYSSRICRDPFGSAPDWTATADCPPTPGQQKDARAWSMKVHAGVPLSLQVWHDGARDLQVVLAEFKVIIPDYAAAP